MKCPKCQFENWKGAKFCKERRVKLEHTCPKCSTQFNPKIQWLKRLRKR